jgi:hypothetical protein
MPLHSKSCWRYRDGLAMCASVLRWHDVTCLVRWHDSCCEVLVARRFLGVPAIMIDENCGGARELFACATGLQGVHVQVIVCILGTTRTASPIESAVLPCRSCRVLVSAAVALWCTAVGVCSTRVMLQGSLRVSWHDAMAVLVSCRFYFLDGNQLSGSIPSTLGNLTVLK